MPPVKTNWNESERNFYTILNLIVLFKGKKDTGYTAKFWRGRSEINKSAPVYHAFRGSKMYEAYRQKMMTRPKTEPTHLRDIPQRNVQPCAVTKDGNKKKEGMMAQR